MVLTVQSGTRCHRKLLLGVARKPGVPIWIVVCKLQVTQEHLESLLRVLHLRRHFEHRRRRMCLSPLLLSCRDTAD